MKKENVFVPIESEKQANDYRLILEAMNQKVAIPTWYYQGKENGLWFGGDDIGFTCFYGANENKNTKITFGQLIDLLNEPKKLAVRVENEKEFKALMKYYDSLGWKWTGGSSPMSKTSIPEYPNLIMFQDGFMHSLTKETIRSGNYKIIPFAEFAKEHVIKLPLLTSEDGVDLFEGDTPCWVMKDTKEITLPKNILSECHTSIVRHYLLFSNEQAALSWIEAQKPKEAVLQFGAYKFTIKKDSVNVSHGDSDNFIDIKSIYKAFLELN